MEATALKKFIASMGSCSYDCEEGDKLEGDAKTIEQLEAMGLVTTKKTKGGKPGKAGRND